MVRSMPATDGSKLPSMRRSGSLLLFALSLLNAGNRQKLSVSEGKMVGIIQQSMVTSVGIITSMAFPISAQRLSILHGLHGLSINQMLYLFPTSGRKISLPERPSRWTNFTLQPTPEYIADRTRATDSLSDGDYLVVDYQLMCIIT